MSSCCTAYVAFWSVASDIMQRQFGSDQIKSGHHGDIAELMQMSACREENILT